MIDRSEIESVDSRASVAIDEVVGARSLGPRKKALSRPTLQAVKESNREAYLSKNALLEHDKTLKIHEQNFRQPLAIEKGDAAANHSWDSGIDRYFKNFCRALIEEAQGGPRQREVAHYVNHYGTERSGYLTYPEFKEVFETHAMPIMYPQGPPQEDAKVRALFQVFDVQSRGAVPRADFVSAINRSGPALDFVGRLSHKVRKGGARLIRALTEEF